MVSFHRAIRNANASKLSAEWILGKLATVLELKNVRRQHVASADSDLFLFWLEVHEDIAQLDDQLHVLKWICSHVEFRFAREPECCLKFVE